MKNTIYFEFKSKKYPCEMEIKGKDKYGDHTTHVKCPVIGIDQEYLTEDIPELIADLPGILGSLIEHRKRKSETMRFRVSIEDRAEIEKMAKQKGYKSISRYLRDAALKV